MARRSWNRNVHYHPLVLEAMPCHCGRALDVGCGTGRLAAELAERCGDVTGIDADAPALDRARAAHRNPNLRFVHGDVMKYDEGPFDFISSIATVHHLPFDAALHRFDRLLRPGGTLAVVGLYRLWTLSDIAWAHVGTAVSAWHSLTTYPEPIGAPTRDPKETLEDIRAMVGTMLPGAEFDRLLLFRYSIVWRKP